MLPSPEGKSMAAPRYAAALRYLGVKSRMSNWLIEQFDAWYDPMDLEIWLSRLVVELAPN